MIDERQLDHCWEIIIKPALLEYLNKPVKNGNNGLSSAPSNNFNLSAIRWKVGRGQDRRDADPDEAFSYCFVEDTRGETHPEVKPLWDAVARYGEVHTDGWVITQFGDRTKMLAKRRPKEG